MRLQTYLYNEFVMIPMIVEAWTPNKTESHWRGPKLGIKSLWVHCG